MKKTSILIAIVAVLAGSGALMAGQVDFDGACGGKAAGFGTGFGAALTRTTAPESPAPQSPAPAACGAAAAGPVLNVAVEKNATSKQTFAADGSQAAVPSVKYLIEVKTPGSASQWAVGDNDKIYSLGAARPAPEFAAVRKLADTLALLGRGGETRGHRCETDTSYVCINGQTNSCSVDKCGWCGKYDDGTYGCEWDTTSQPYACRPNGYRC